MELLLINIKPDISTLLRRGHFYFAMTTKNTFIAMIEGIKEKVIKKGIIDEDTFNKGIEDLYRTTFKDGVFCYTFFKGIGYK